ncbi:hypothetical protein [Solidesulfovibrio sp. C21]|uniref:hypothetical protein n=1 Tax=Solidesulfovibrio sp. C21 TaxID=3398613 RepID=UPI0039FB8E19
MTRAAGPCYVPTTLGYGVVVSPGDPDRFLEALRRAAAPGVAAPYIFTTRAQAHPGRRQTAGTFRSRPPSWGWRVVEVLWDALYGPPRGQSGLPFL